MIKGGRPFPGKAAASWRDVEESAAVAVLRASSSLRPLETAFI